MKRFRQFPALLVLVCLSACGCGDVYQSSGRLEVPPPPAASLTPSADRLQTGIYLVNRWTIEKQDLDPLLDDELFVEYREEEFQELEDDEPEPAKYLTLSRTEFIPLELAAEPSQLAGDDGRTEVGLTFSETMARRLTDFSRKYLGRQVALVIGGDVITLHKVRSVLTDNGMKISRCTDDGCELILARLKSPD